MPALWERAAALRLPVFPCLPDKRPACPHGFKDAATDPFAICELFRAYPGELVGMPTGAVSGLDVLDIDSPRHPEAARWVSDAGLPPTRVQQTKSGGFHYLFRHHAGLRNWTSRPVAGVDGRADGGYVIAWQCAGLPIQGESVAEWPDALIAAVTRASAPVQRRAPPRPTEPRVEQVIRRIGAAMNGERNNLLFWGACRFAEWIALKQMPQSVAINLLVATADAVGLPKDEAWRTIQSAINRPPS